MITVPTHCRLVLLVDRLDCDVGNLASTIKTSVVSAVGVSGATFRRLHRGGYIDRVKLEQTPRKFWPEGARAEDIIPMLYGKPILVLEGGL